MIRYLNTMELENQIKLIGSLIMIFMIPMMLTEFKQTSNAAALSIIQTSANRHGAN